MMAAVARERVIVLLDGVTHARHPMWTRLTVCGEVLVTPRPVRNRSISCNTCRRAIPNRELEQRDEHAALLPPRRVTRPRMQREPEFVDVDVACVCGHRQTDTLAGDGPMRASLAKLVCRSCGRVGLQTAPVFEPPFSIDPDDIT